MRLAPATVAVLSAALWLPAAAAGEDLTIYSSLPLSGDSRAQSQDVVRGEQLEQSGGRAGAFPISRSTTPRAAPASGRR